MRALQVLALLAAAAHASALYPSTETPGGIDRERTPMFVLFTHDDALKYSSYEAMLAVTDGRQSLNGCPAVGTMFTTTSGTDCDLVVDMHSRGYEIADHTMRHPSLRDLDKEGIEEEVLGARSKLAECGIPESDIVGLRCPYLETKPEVREVLAENGFLYDSTLIEEVTGNSISNGFSERAWPWDMEQGIPINCGWYKSIQSCDDDESHPNVWQVPLWPLSELGGPYTMDYGDDEEHDLYDILVANFDSAYNGNRAPFPVFGHTPWMERSDNLEDLAKFADYALSKPDVYFVTIRQLIAWMQNPVPADELTPERLGCGNPGGAGPQPNNMYILDRTTGGSTGTAQPSPAVPSVEAPGPAPVEAPTPAPAPAPGPQEEELGDGEK